MPETTNIGLSSWSGHICIYISLLHKSVFLIAECLAWITGSCAEKSKGGSWPTQYDAQSPSCLFSREMLHVVRSPWFNVLLVFFCLSLLFTAFKWICTRNCLYQPKEDLLVWEISIFQCASEFKKALHAEVAVSCFHKTLHWSACTHVNQPKLRV